MPLRALLVDEVDRNPLQQRMTGHQGNDLNAMMFGIPHPSVPPSGVSDQIFIDAYFLYYHTAYPFLHETTFRAQYEGRIPQPKGSAWPILLNTVLAIGAWSIGDETSTMDDAYYHEVNRLSQDASVFEVGNLTLVQALLLLSNYTQKRNKPNTGWNYLGLAVRMALSLGLHKEFPEWKISLLQREMRRRVWWGLYIFDSGASITFGRPVLLPEDSIMDANEVLNIHEEVSPILSDTCASTYFGRLHISLLTYNQHLRITTNVLPQEVSNPTVYSGLIHQTAFHRATNPLYHRLISNPPPTFRELLELQKPIDAWQNSIPSYFQLTNIDLHRHEALILARYRLSWRAWNLRVILYRPVVLRWAARRWATTTDEAENEDPDEEQCRLLCLQSARETIASISEYMSGNVTSRLGSWYMLYFLFQAGLIPIMFLITSPTSPSAPSWLDDLRITKDLLSYASISNRLAGRCLEVIDRLCAPLLEAEQPEVMLQDPGLFNDVHSMFVGDQGDGMEYLDWSNFGLQWGV
jgi:transcriptional regulatory protein GAL4